MSSKQITLRASQAALWGKCPGALTKTVADFSDASHADEGTLIHAVAEYKLRMSQQKPTHPDVLFYYEISRTRADVDEIDELVGYYIDIVQIYLLYSSTATAVLIEQSMEYKRGNVKIQGTADLILIDDEVKKITVFDLKTGYLPVAAEGNSQLTLYAHMIANTYSLNDYTYQLVVVQPRPRVYDASPETPINENYLPALIDAVKDDIDNEKLNAGAHCRYCVAKMYCPELQKQFKYMHSPEFAGRVHNGPETWQDVVRYEKVFKTMFDDAKRAMTSFFDMAQGTGRENLTENIRVVQKNVRRAWLPGIDPAEFAKTMKLPKSKITESKIKSPTQLMKEGLNERQKQIAEQHMSMIRSTSFELVDDEGGNE